MTLGEQTREFNYVEDIVAGMLRASEVEGIEGEIISIGCGVPITIREVATQILELMNHPIELQLGKLPYRPGEAWQFYCSNDKARRLLGWQPRVTLQEGLRRTIAWSRDSRPGVAHGS